MAWASGEPGATGCLPSGGGGTGTVIGGAPGGSGAWARPRDRADARGALIWLSIRSTPGTVSASASATSATDWSGTSPSSVTTRSCTLTLMSCSWVTRDEASRSSTWSLIFSS